MPQPLTIAIPHRLGREEAKRRIDAGFVRLQPEISRLVAAIEYRWDGDRLNLTARVLAQTLAGRIDVLDDLVRVEVDLPWMLNLFGAPLLEQVRSRGVAMLEKPPADRG